MNKTEIKQHIKYFLEGKLNKEYEKELLHWIKASETNRNFFLEEQKSQLVKTSSKKNNHLNSEWKKLKQQIASPSQKQIISFYYKIGTIAAAFLTGIIFTTVFYLKIQNSSESTVQNISTPFGAKTNLILPDGSEVWLNSGSTISFPNHFSETRTITLKGEAFFDVKKKNKPFIVSTHFGEVEVKGTSFNIKAFDNESFETTLVTGIVNIIENNSKKTVTLNPGQQAIISNSKIRICKVETDFFTSWKEGKLIFREEYLPSAIKRLERWYNVKIELDDDPRLSKIWYSGTLEMESFSEVLELLKVTAPIDYQYNQKTRTIKINYKQI